MRSAGRTSNTVRDVLTIMIQLSDGRHVTSLPCVCLPAAFRVTVKSSAAEGDFMTYTANVVEVLKNTDKGDVMVTHTEIFNIRHVTRDNGWSRVSEKMKNLTNVFPTDFSFSLNPLA